MTTATLAAFFAAARTIAGPPTSTCSMHSSTGAPEATVTALPQPACHADCGPVAAGLCLAVLVAAGAVALLVAAARRRAGPYVPARSCTAVPPRPGRPPPAAPDPVEDLCVSRT